jgi:clusterin-associated protein 1
MFQHFKQTDMHRPAFMDEYEKVEQELKVIYDTYVEKFRNISYLEHLLHNLEASDIERMRDKQDAVKKMLAKMEKEELHLLREDAQMTAEETKKLLDEVEHQLAEEDSQSLSEVSSSKRAIYLKQQPQTINKRPVDSRRKSLDFNAAQNENETFGSVKLSSEGNMNEDIFDFYSYRSS